MRCRRALAPITVLAMLAACGEEPPPEPDPASLRPTRSGEVRGFLDDDGAHVWRGIPFAASTAGERRWRPPLPEEPWEGVRDARRFGAPCPQLDRDGEPKGDEDCLSLNVYAPRFAPEAVPPPDRGLPVMVFIHGGGNSIGDAHLYDAARLAAENRVVVVTVHYRLGVFGWLSHPALRSRAASADEASGNWGTLDLVAGLEWVRDDIAGFGGDPGRVTVFGESAGGINVYSLLLSPRARGLFHRAIAQSGFATSFTREQAENLRDAPAPGDPSSSGELLLALLREDGRAETREQAKAVAEAMSPEEIRDFLRSRSAAQLLGAFDGGVGMGGMYFAPFVLRDGHVVPDEEPLVLLSQGRYNQVPFVAGTNRDEHKLFQAFVSPHARRVFGIPVGLRDPRRYDLVAEYGSKLWKASGADEPVATMRAHQGPSVFAYRFDWDELARPMWIDLPRLIGAAHGLELFFVFGGTRSGFADRLMDDPERADVLSRQMRSYWARFAAAGDPGRGQEERLPRWTPWETRDGAPRFMVFDSERDGGLRMANGSLTRDAVVAGVRKDDRLRSDAERCEIYRLFAQWSDALPREEYASLEACAEDPLPPRDPFGWQGS